MKRECISMRQGQKREKRAAQRIAAALLCVVMLWGLFPPATANAVDPSIQAGLNKLVQWEVMKGDSQGRLWPERSITRAEFCALLNRAYGYTKAGGKTPFTDVPASAWYAEDISIGYAAGYFNGTSAKTASPRANLSREQATVILARIMRLQDTPGEVIEFTDGNDLRSWSKGSVRTAAQMGLVGGYPDGSFRPKNNITRGAMAKILANAVGNRLYKPGEYTIGNAYGNLTVAGTGVVLKNTTITGDLYITGGVGQGYVTLENVKVLGRIVVNGAGESNKGKSSIVMRNVDAKELLVDSLTNQYVSIRTEGDTIIPVANVRSNAFIEDRTPTGSGLLKIVQDGRLETTLDLAGNIEEVINQTPGSTLNITQGNVKLLTVDEAAVGSKLSINVGASVKTLNLDVGTKITGKGDVGNLNISAPGCGSSMLPDSIVIRPGITADIAGVVMDSIAAKESSAEPRILAAYPKVKDIGPTSANAVFSANKQGTIYWAISAISDGSIGESDLITPPSYGARILKSGNAKVDASNKDITAKVIGLTAAGSYYLSAVLVDARGWRSPVKVVSFSTPDDTVPNFATGYPVMSKITDTSAQVSVMPTKSCKLYYALLPKGSTAPKENDFKANAVTGNMGYGVVDVTKNVVDFFTINDKPLQELETYDLYLWLTDVENGKSAPVKKLTFTTVDRTPPIFRTEPTVNSIKTTSIGCVFNLNEDGTVYWVAVKEGTEYPKPPAGSSGTVDWTSDQAKLQVASGMNAFKSGSSTCKGNADTTFTVNGLTVETAYDIYYVAMDKAGNYGKTIGKLTANTLDDIAPTVTQAFTRYPAGNNTSPLPGTDVQLIFSEGVQRATTNESLLKLYSAVSTASGAEKVKAKDALALALRATLMLYSSTGTSLPTRVAERVDDTVTNWVIDYRNATVEMKNGQLVVTFPTTNDATQDSALNLSSGSTYYFQIEDIADTSSNKNIMGVTKLPEFTTISAQAALKAINVTSAAVGGATVPIDMAFSLTPVSTSKVDASIDWDMLLWSDTTVVYELYVRTKDRTSGAVKDDWTQVKSADGNTTDISVTVPGGGYMGRSVGKDLLGYSEFPQLKPDVGNSGLKEELIYEYGIRFTKLEGMSDRETWSKKMNFKVSVVAGSSVNLGNLAADVTETNFKDAISLGLADLSSPANFTLPKQFTDSKFPIFTDGYPEFEPGDGSVKMTVLLDRPGTVYYVVAPVGLITTNGVNGLPVNFNNVPTDGTMVPPRLVAPGYLSVVQPKYNNVAIKTGVMSADTGASEIRVDGLKDKTDYYVYFVTKGTGQVFSEVELYRFTTTEISRPVITLEVSNPTVYVKSTASSTVNYMLIDYNTSTMASLLKEPFINCVSPENVAEITTKYGVTFSALNAMATDYPINGVSRGSIFDQYATQSYKERVAELIRSQTTSSASVVDTGEVAVPSPNRAVSVSCKNMVGFTQYCFLAVGKSELGSGDAFRAIYPVVLPDNGAPMVNVLNAAGALSATGNRWTGVVTVVFNEDLYYYDTSGSAPTSYAVDTAPLILSGAATARKPNFRSVESVVSNHDSFIELVTKDTNVNQTTQTIQLKVTGAINGTSIVFRGALADSFGNTRANAPLSISLKIKDGEATFVVTPAWDAR